MSGLRSGIWHLIRFGTASTHRYRKKYRGESAAGQWILLFEPNRGNQKIAKARYRLERTDFIGCRNTAYMDVDDAEPCPFCGSRKVTIYPFGQGTTSYVEGELRYIFHRQPASAEGVPPR